MTAVTRRVLEMCVRVLSWIEAHPDDEAGFLVLVARLKALFVRIGQVIADQRSGMVSSGAASTRKEKLQREMLAIPIAHLAQIGALAAQEQHELGKIFRFRPTADTFVAFQSAARTMFEQAETHKEVLVKYGLSESVLVDFGKQLDEFDATVKLGLDGRTLHTAATRELETLTKEIRKIARAMDARNRQRFRNDPQAFELWVSARSILGTPREASNDAAPGGQGGTPNAGGEEKPAA